jgi:hypothetical protein
LSFRKKISTHVDKETGKTYHVIDGNNIQCDGKDCFICKDNILENFGSFLKDIPFPIPPKGKRYKKKKSRDNQGKTVKEICYTCKTVPCFICKRTECKLWHKEEDLKGQEKGCNHWNDGLCMKWVCEKGIIKKRFA